MSDLKVVLYKENSQPRSLELSTKTVYKTLTFISLLSVALIASVILGLRAHFSKGKAISTQTANIEIGDGSAGNSPEDQIRTLKDQVEQMNQKLKNQALVAGSNKEIDKTNPALALFAPIIKDETKSSKVDAKNFKFSPASAKNPATLSFELHNTDPESGSQKGYIIVLARSENTIDSYPDTMLTNSPYLIDFEKGETFNIARFRMANAQFNHLSNTNPKSLQVFIFNREGGLWINKNVDIGSAGVSNGSQ